MAIILTINPDKALAALILSVPKRTGITNVPKSNRPKLPNISDNRSSWTSLNSIKIIVTREEIVSINGDYNRSLTVGTFSNQQSTIQLLALKHQRLIELGDKNEVFITLLIPLSHFSAGQCN